MRPVPESERAALRWKIMRELEMNGIGKEIEGVERVRAIDSLG
jgi:hypothetical protein